MSNCVLGMYISKLALKGELNCQNQAVLTYDICYPRFQSGKFKNAAMTMNNFYRCSAAELKRRYEKELYCMAVNDLKCRESGDFPTYQGVQDFKVCYNGNCTLSVYYDKYEFTGGAHGTTLRCSDTWNLQSGLRMKISDFFSPCVNFCDYVTGAVKAEIKRQIDCGEVSYFDDWEKLVNKTFNQRSFYLTEKGVTVYFQQYDIAPYAAGIRNFCIPFEEGKVIEPCCKSC